jgi:hypothetical protein
MKRSGSQGSFPRRLSAIHHPVAVAFDIPRVAERAVTVRSELAAHAAVDRDRCCGYFPALEGVPGIEADLPACREFATHLPLIRCGGAEYRFNFLRLSLKQQSVDPAYHLDSDAATALTGDVTTLQQRRVVRLLLNLSSENERTLRYLDVEPECVDLVADKSYLRVADPRTLSTRARTAVIPERRGSHVAGFVFAANRVLHSGVDSTNGHFVAAYGIDVVDDTPSTGCPA